MNDGIHYDLIPETINTLSQISNTLMNSAINDNKLFLDILQIIDNVKIVYLNEML